MRIAALAPQFEPLRDAKAMLFVDDGQAQAREVDAVLDQRVRSDNELRVACGVRQAPASADSSPAQLSGRW